MLHATHGFIEHDGSLSRADIYHDPSNKFDPKTFDNFLSYFGNETHINLKAMANARARHALDLSKTNPNFTIAEASVPVLVGEVALMLAIWGHPLRQIANRAYLEYFFRQSLPSIITI